MKPLNNAYLSLIFLLVSFSPAFGQSTFKYFAELPAVDTNGFYLVRLSPDLVAKCKQDLADLRIYASKTQTVPFINADNLTQNEKNTFLVLPEVDYKSEADTGTTYVAYNQNRLTINQLILKLRNTEVDRTVNLTGSDDLKTWYAIKENVILEKAGQSKSGSYDQMLEFPPVTIYTSRSSLRIKIRSRSESYRPVQI